MVSFVFGNFMYVYYYILGLAKREYDDLILIAFVVPFYWILMSYAALLAFINFIYKPHYWSKTKHGAHLLPIHQPVALPAS